MTTVTAVLDSPPDLIAIPGAAPVDPDTVLVTSPPGPFLIAVEGIDGSGKSTLARALADDLAALLTHEPGATGLGRTLRRLALHPQPGEEPAPLTEALLMAADRSQHLAEVIEPALAAGRHVVTDRYVGSTLAYQGYGRGLDLGTLATINRVATTGRYPDLTILVDVSVETALARLGTLDHIEAQGEEYFHRVRMGFLMLARRDPRWVTVDASGPPEEVHALARRALGEALGL